MNDIPEYDPLFAKKGYLRLEPGLLYDLDFLELDSKEEGSFFIAAKEYLGLPSTIFFMSIREDVSALFFSYMKDKKTEANQVFLHNVRTRIRSKCRLFRNLREQKLLKLYQRLVSEKGF